MKGKTVSEKFSFCVGRPWPGSKTNIRLYAYGTEVYYGKMSDAEAFRKYVDKQTGEKNFIYKLVKVPKK